MTTGEDVNFVITSPPANLPPMKCLGSTFFYKMGQYKNFVAQTDGISGEQESYKTVLKKSIRAAVAMRRRGLKPKDVITICSYYHLDYLIPYYASLFLGAVSANLDPEVPLADTVHLLKQVRPKMIFVVPEALALIEDTVKEAELDARIVVFGKNSNYETFSKFLAAHSEESTFTPFEVEDLQETAGIVFSSGTTGLPKGVCLTHYQMLGNTHIAMPPAQPGSNFLVLSNLNWILGTAWTVYIILHGLNRVMCRSFEASKGWNIIQKNKINMASLVPLQFTKLFENGIPSNVNASSLKFVLLVGFFITESIVNHVRRCLPGAIVMNSYGSTETFGRVFNFEPEHEDLMIRKPTSLGKPIRGYTYKVVDPETDRNLGPNQEGELRIKTEFCMKGYYGLDSSDVWDADGFFKTGDVVYYDEECCFYVVDRIKDLIKYQVWHIAPTKLEKVLRTHPAVKSAIVTGVPHPVDGDRLLGLVVLKKNFVGKVADEEICRFVDERVAFQEKLRGGVRFVEGFPATVSGKVKRRVIRNALIEGKFDFVDSNT